MDLSAIQSALRERNIDAWLFYDHHHRDPIAYRVLGLPKDLVVQFEATMTSEQIATHFAARDAIDPITAEAFKEIGRRVRNGGTNEFAMKQWILEAFRRENLISDDPPVVAVNANSGDPHYDPRAEP